MLNLPLPNQPQDPLSPSHTTPFLPTNNHLPTLLPSQLPVKRQPAALASIRHSTHSLSAFVGTVEAALVVFGAGLHSWVETHVPVASLVDV